MPLKSGFSDGLGGGNLLIKEGIVLYLHEEKDRNINDYKFMCYHGKCKNLFVCTGRAKKDLRIDFFDTEWNHLPFERHYPNSNLFIPKPEKFEEMKSIAEILAQAIDNPIVRIDLYQINCQIYFGEITFYPGSGFEKFAPIEWDYKLGKLIKLPTNNHRTDQQHRVFNIFV